MTSRFPWSPGDDSDARHHVVFARVRKLLDGFDRVLEEVDQHLLKSIFLNPYHIGRTYAVDVDLGCLAR